jgi:hypothetical protein
MTTQSRAVSMAASLIPNSDYIKWKERIIHLPGDIAKASIESKELFVKILNCHNVFNMKKLTPAEQKAAFDKAWLDYVKNNPLSYRDNVIKTTFTVIEIAGMVFLFIIGARACL